MGSVYLSMKKYLIKLLKSTIAQHFVLAFIASYQLMRLGTGGGEIKGILNPRILTFSKSARLIAENPLLHVIFIVRLYDFKYENPSEWVS